MKMKISPKGVQLIKDSEGFKARPYLCPVGKPTIGYGSTFYPNGRKVTMQDKMVTEHEASIMLDYVVACCERDVLILVKVTLTQGQFDALVDFVYNIGADIDADTIPEGLGDSTLLKKLNAKDYKGATTELLKWNKGKNPKTGVREVMRGLDARRKREVALFISE